MRIRGTYQKGVFQRLKTVKQKQGLPYAYCANNPMKYVDLHGDSLTYTGDAQAAANMHNTHLGGYYNVTTDATTGLVSMTTVEGMDLSQMSPEQKSYADALNTVANGAGMTTINVVKDDTGVLIGDVTTSTIDIGDMSKLPTGGFAPVNSASTMIHEVWEQYQVQVNSVSLNPANPNWDAHVKSTRLEGTVIQQGMGISPVREMVPAASSTGYMDVNSSNGKARIHVRDKNIIGVSYYR
jgi:hypothetical protein